MSHTPDADHTGVLRAGNRVATWPRVSAAVRPDGTGTLTVNGTERPCRAASLEELRTGVIARCASLARRLGRPVRLSVTDPAGTWTLAVRGEGVVQLLDDDGAIAPADGLAPHEGRCRACRRLQPVSVDRCVQCGTDEPHRVEADPVDARAVVPDAGTVDTLEERTRAEAPAGAHGAAAPPVDGHAPTGTGPRWPAGDERHKTSGDAPPAPRSLSLRFSTQPGLVSDQGLALGRNPEPVGGRRPVRVASPERMLSRTHAFVDLDAAGRIVVTDHHSGNGVEVQTRPPTRLEPGTPYVVAPGSTLLLGDVAVLVDLA